jgi:hypothetical protein
MSYQRLPRRTLAAAALLAAAGFAATASAQFKNAPISCVGVESIGTADMSADGVITLHLHSLAPDPIAEGVLTYAPDDPQYDEIKKHLGGIAPGESKQVRPWC